MSERFWEAKTLEQMSQAEWESLCDGCARCCLKKLEDEDSGEVVYTAVVCRYLETDSRRCTVYPDRHRLVAACIAFDAGDVAAMHWLPRSCAYRRVAEGRGLADWHPLLQTATSADADPVHAAGIAVTGRTINELGVPDDELESYVIRWVET